MVENAAWCRYSDYLTYSRLPPNSAIGRLCILQPLLHVSHPFLQELFISSLIQDKIGITDRNGNNKDPVSATGIIYTIKENRDHVPLHANPDQIRNEKRIYKEACVNDELRSSCRSRRTLSYLLSCNPIVGFFTPE